ncbi:hypothetical protein Y1Q_0002184 [Alligator mississippiensis]|uniref:Uncharacterized protein n=1 Tax=Alligator mississippiensis TaxID=8496 RepID=A0A151MPV5_ALLMI|nr:hypothetical protein Y1Q_0002184 [Alligator mississippiensis]
MRPELLQEIPEGGLGHPEGFQPLLVILGVLDNTPSPVLADLVSPEMAELETQKGDSSPDGDILEPVIGIPARIWLGGQGLSGRGMVTALGQHVLGGQVVSACGRAERGKTAVGYPVVSTVGQQGQPGGQQGHKALVISQVQGAAKVQGGRGRKGCAVPALHMLLLTREVAGQRAVSGAGF